MTNKHFQMPYRPYAPVIKDDSEWSMVYTWAANWGATNVEVDPVELHMIHMYQTALNISSQQQTVNVKIPLDKLSVIAKILNRLDQLTHSTQHLQSRALSPAEIIEEAAAVIEAKHSSPAAAKAYEKFRTIAALSKP